MLAKSRKLRKKGCTLYCTWCNTICPQKMGLHSGCKNLKFLLHDIDVLGKTVLELLSEPRNINDLMAAMPQYFEVNVILYNSDALREYLIKIISQLFLFKAIKPINLESFND